MRTQTYSGLAARRPARPTWLPWLLVATAWLAAVLLGLFDRAETGAATSGTAESTSLSPQGALEWYAAHPRAPVPVPSTPAAATEVPAKAPAAAVEADGAIAVSDPATPAAKPAVDDASPRAPSPARASDSAPVNAANTPAPSAPRPTEGDDARAALAARPTPLPTIDVGGAPAPDETPAAASAPPAVDDAPSPAPRPGDTAQSATARATTHLSAKRWTEAEAAFTTALALPGGRSAAVLYGRARARRAQDNVAAAEADLKEALVLDARHPYALLLLGDLAKTRGDVTTARDAYKRYVAAWPNGRRAGELNTWLENPSR